jgi:hypothetical protein
LGILTELDAHASTHVAGKRNKVDRILEDLDDADRELVEGWLRGGTSEEWIEMRLWQASIQCSDTTIRRGRKLNGIAYGPTR